MTQRHRILAYVATPFIVAVTVFAAVGACLVALGLGCMLIVAGKIIQALKFIAGDHP